MVDDCNYITCSSLFCLHDPLNNNNNNNNKVTFNKHRSLHRSHRSLPSSFPVSPPAGGQRRHFRLLFGIGPEHFSIPPPHCSARLSRLQGEVKPSPNTSLSLAIKVRRHLSSMSPPSRRLQTKPVITCLKTFLVSYSLIFWVSSAGSGQLKEQQRAKRGLANLILQPPAARLKCANTHGCQLGGFGAGPKSHLLEDRGQMGVFVPRGCLLAGCLLAGCLFAGLPDQPRHIFTRVEKFQCLI